jgi:uncharacterized protein YeaO (DUF488 family)
MIQIKRVYDARARADGRRILVERLWPRGLTKASLAADAWLKDVAPSTELRRWFGHDVARWPEFQRRYRAELDANPAVRAAVGPTRGTTVTLLYSAHDRDHNSAVVLRDYIRSGPSQGPAPPAMSSARRSRATLDVTRPSGARRGSRK